MSDLGGRCVVAGPDHATPADLEVLFVWHDVRIQSHAGFTGLIDNYSRPMQFFRSKGVQQKVLLHLWSKSPWSLDCEFLATGRSHVTAAAFEVARQTADNASPLPSTPTQSINISNRE